MVIYLLERNLKMAKTNTKDNDLKKLFLDAVMEVLKSYTTIKQLKDIALRKVSMQNVLTEDDYNKLSSMVVEIKVK